MVYINTASHILDMARDKAFLLFLSLHRPFSSTANCAYRFSPRFILTPSWKIRSSMLQL
jgi:hypothetical protein